MISDMRRLLTGGWMLIAILFLAACAAPVRGDVLELRTGEIVQGKFLGGSPLNIRFQVDGQEQTFATRQVLNIGFSDTGDGSGGPAVDSVPPAKAKDADPDANRAPAPEEAATPAAGNAAQQDQSDTQGTTIPAGTPVIVRMIDSINSSTNKIGDVFHASLESPLVVGDTVVAPKGADAYGTLAQAKDAGKISGAPELTLELTGIRINGTVVQLDSTDYNVAGKSRGKQSAERIGGGAIVGAVLGGIIGGPKGAAIGATLGAGGGTAAQVMTHGDQVRVPSETVLEFRLQQDVTVVGAGGPARQ
jgi:hypothetical protein